MSVDLVGVTDAGARAVAVAVLLFGVFRALQLRRVFANPTYHSRATWSAFLMLVIIATNLSDFLPATSSATLSLLEGLPFIALIIVILGFVDRSVIVAIQTDFFHRNTLHWLRLRWPAGVTLVAVATIAFPGFVLLPSFNSFFPPAGYPIWGTIFFFMILLVLPLLLSYLTAALIVGARRTSDRALKRNILFIGLALSTLVISIVATAPFNQGTWPYVIINDGTNLVGIYLLYRSVMSLSPIGRVEKAVEAASVLANQGPNVSRVAN